jgi:hypothetical protein
LYVKLFSSILTSSVWSEDMPTRLVWITLLALSDKDGDVRSSPSGLARLANVPLEQCQAALDRLMSPDPEDPTQEHEGRRIEQREGGWFIYKYAHYRALQDVESRKASWRESSRRHRQRKSAPSARRQRKSTEADADTEAYTKAEATQHTHGAKFVEASHCDAYLATRESVKNPTSFDAMLGTLHEPISGGQAFGWHTIGQALLELRSNGSPVTANAIRAFCRKLTQPEPEKNGYQSKQERGRAALLRGLQRNGFDNGKPADDHEVSRAVPGALPHTGVDRHDG